MYYMKNDARLVAMASLLGLPAGLVWLKWATPAQWLATERGLVMTEELAAGQFDVVAAFTVIGLVVGLVVGLTVSLLSKRKAWRLVPVAIAGSLAAVARIFGPADPRDATGVELGQLVSTQFVVDAWPAFLAWPLTALFIVTVAIYIDEDLEDLTDLEPEPRKPESLPSSLE